MSFYFSNQKQTSQVVSRKIQFTSQNFKPLTTLKMREINNTIVLNKLIKKAKQRSNEKQFQLRFQHMNHVRNPYYKFAVVLIRIKVYCKGSHVWMFIEV